MFVGNYKAKRAKYNPLHTVRWKVPQHFTEYQVFVNLKLQLNQTQQPKKPLQLRQGWQTRRFAGAEKIPRAKKLLRVRSARPRRALAPPSPSRPRALAVSPSRTRRLTLEPSPSRPLAIAAPSPSNRLRFSSTSTSQRNRPWFYIRYTTFCPFSPIFSRYLPFLPVKQC